MVAVVKPEEHLGLVHSIAQKYRGRGDMEELVSEGKLGLMRAAAKFDPSRGVSFGTYASWWIQSFINRWLTGRDRVMPIPGPVFRQMRTEDALPAWAPSFDIADPAPRPDEVAERAELRAALAKAAERLPPRTRYVIRRRVLDERTLEEVGTELGLSRERVRQIEAEGLKRLRKELEPYHEFLH